MTAWRIPTPREQARDARTLGTFLEPEVAAAIAAMPVVDLCEQLAPFAVRADAWCYRVDRLLCRRLERAA